VPGTFSKANRPKRPGAYFNFEGAAAAALPAATGATVAIPFTHDWGPFKVPVTVSGLPEFVATFGVSTQTPAYRAVRQAFQGEGVAGRAGAGSVVCYRFGGAAAAKALLTLTNTSSATPAIRLVAKYEGTYGNNLRVTTQDYVADATQNELVLFDGTVEIERYRYADTDIANLAAQINAASDWVDAVGPAGGGVGTVVTGTALTAVTSSSLTGGNNGDAAITGADMTAMRTALEVERFGLFAYADLEGLAFSGTTSAAELAAHKAWAVGTTAVPGLNRKGKRFLSVFGGPLNETVSAAITARVLSKDTAGGTRVEKSLTSYTTTTDSAVPYLIYRNPKFLLTMMSIETELTEWCRDHVIGLLPVNDKTRDAVAGELKARLERRVPAVIQPNPTVGVDENPPPSDSDEFVALVYGIAFGRSIEQVFNTVRIG
jgi:hypothetical protein